MINKADWEWYGNAGHFICGHSCRFHLCTKVGSYLISTVGEYVPDSFVRAILKESRNGEKVELPRIFFDDRLQGIFGS